MASEASTLSTPTNICIKWNGREMQFAMDATDTVSTLKHRVQGETNVSAKRAKLLGLKLRDGKPASDESCVADLVIKPGAKIMMMGTPDAEIEQAAKDAASAPEVQDDFDISEEAVAELDISDKPEVQAKLQRRIQSVEVKILNAPRLNKKCLVLDIDYTLFDLGSNAERPEELARPYLHEFLTACYAQYDIIIWSATSMKWVEVKMKELGVLGHPEYKITCMLDHAAMLTVHTEKYGVFDCKPLAFIWAKFPDQYHASNTIMLDDLRRNYVMNRQQGLVIRPYRKAHLTRGSDRELLHLTTYLTSIGDRESLADLNHKLWEEFIRRRRS
ncbi:MAG: hypothetical protein WDW38_007082 [Sanguina aurantia]